MEMTHFGSGIWSYSVLTAGAILVVSVPETIIRSDWRGVAPTCPIRPKRSRSCRAMNVPIISMAQQARPNVIGHRLLLRAHWKSWSTVVVTTPLGRRAYRFSGWGDHGPAAAASPAV